VVDLRDIINRHKGEKFLICGTGCSIDDFPVEFFTEWDGITIGCNDITDRFQPDYYLNIHNDKNTLLYNRVLTTPATAEKINLQYRSPSVGVDVERSGLVSLRGTVATTMLTVAYNLGASEIHLVGIDLKTWGDQHHMKGCKAYFFSDDHPPDMDDQAVVKGIKEGVQLESHIIQKECELAATVNFFERAFETYRARGVKFYNLSRDSKLRGIEYLNLSGVEHDKGNNTGHESSFATL